MCMSSECIRLHGEVRSVLWRYDYCMTPPTVLTVNKYTTQIKDVTHRTAKFIEGTFWKLTRHWTRILQYHTGNSPQTNLVSRTEESFCRQLDQQFRVQQEQKKKWPSFRRAGKTTLKVKQTFTDAGG
ncbi:hypothetical protein Bpfe_023011 [Biomphalaria pfeifferi]|uniref:Uncharacterized protein n=1 Tax=Biomphalaria pfeifferi TaxID=112525 RepID=A0AAD8F2E9_BIOPF|nr:hypothetical protein Bpfe_023011 [Biomphalaria pfeifferi]